MGKGGNFSYPIFLPLTHRVSSLHFVRIKKYQIWRELHHRRRLVVQAVVRQPELEELSAVEADGDRQHGQHVGER